MGPQQARAPVDPGPRGVHRARGRTPSGAASLHFTRTARGGPLSDDVQARADARLEEALKRTGARDPRDFYRDRLRELKEADAGAYRSAVDYYRSTLLSSIADDGVDPLAAWTEYGRTLTELLSPGRTWAVDPTGRRIPYEAPADLSHLVLHVPDARRTPTMLVGLPVQLSSAQRATYDWLVKGRNRHRDAS